MKQVEDILTDNELCTVHPMAGLVDLLLRESRGKEDLGGLGFRGLRARGAGCRVQGLVYLGVQGPKNKGLPGSFVLLVGFRVKGLRV